MDSLVDRARDYSSSSQHRGGGGSEGDVPSFRIELFNNGFIVHRPEGLVVEDEEEEESATSGEPVFRPLEDPANRQFVEDLSRGVIPREIQRQIPRNQEIDVRIEDKRGEGDYVPPRRTHFAFQGEAHVMGKRELTEEEERGLVAMEEEGEGVKVNEDEPLASLLLRYTASPSDRKQKRERVSLNHTHTCKHLYLVAKSLVEDGSSPFLLKTGFPPSSLSDMEATVSSLELDGAQVTLEWL